jgi:hypothetical protein
MDVENLAKELILKNMTPEQQMAVLDSVRQSVAQAKEVQKRKIGENVDLVVQALKKIEADIRSRYDDVGNAIEKRVASIKDGRDGINGKDGRDGKDGKAGRDGAKGDKGDAGRDGRDGVDGVDGVSVTSARIDFDGSLIITLSSGVELNVGEVVAPDLAERIKVITNGGGTSQSVLDTLASLQTQITNLIPSQTGNSGKFLTTNGTALSWASVAGGLSYQGTWNASTNTPTLASSTGTNGYYYVVSVAGTTNLNGITDWQAGDWLIFNGSTWQKIDQSWAIAGANDNITSMTGITGGISSPDFVQFDTTATNTNSVGKLYWDDTQKTLTVGLTTNIAADIGQTLYAYVTNDEAITINKGQPVYMYSAQGDRVSVKLAYNTGDATSAKTLGVCAEDIAAGQAGLVLCQGVQNGLNLGAYTAGDTLYLGATAGTLTATKPYAPNHLVYIGVVERANSGNGRLYVRIQNGYEMDELHNVSAQNPSNGQVLIYNASTSLWEKNTLTDGTGISITEGAGSITIANSGVTSAVAGTGISVSSGTGAVTITNSAPDQTVALTAGTGISTSGTYPNFTITNSAPDQTVALTGAGTTSITGTYPNFTITSNDAYTGTVTSVTGTSPVVSSGGTTPAISLASGYGDTQNPYASKTANYVLAAPNGSSGAPTFRAIVAADIPTLNQNTTGTASNVTGTVAIANGGTGQTTANAAFNALVPSQTSNSGKYLTTDGTNTSWSTVSSSATPAAVSDQNNTSTGYFDLPSGTTAQRPASPNAGMMRYNSDTSTYEVYTSTGWQYLSSTAYTYNVEYLVVAGGAGGGACESSAEKGGGGGGAGGYKTATGFTLSQGTTYTVTVGGGGAGGAGGTTNTGSAGSNSVFSTITSTGGGGGGAGSGGSGGGGTKNGVAGGSGGGAGGGGASGGAASPAGQGNAGGSTSGNPTGGGGGGGASAAGSVSSSASGANGGNGSASSITGSSVTYAGGGGGGRYFAGGGSVGSGGTGGGGAGGGGTGTANTGGGGGGGQNGGSGGTAGSGVVILSIPTAYYSGTTTGSPTVTTSGSNTILKFTGSGSYTA